MLKLSQLIYPFLEIFFPVQCHTCKAPLKKGPVPYFCHSCWSSIRPLEGPFCPQCGKPFSSSWTLLFSPTHRCGDCRAGTTYFDQMITPFSFEGVLSEAVSLFKYRKKTALAFPLANLALPFLESLSGIDGVIPVPLHLTRLREREFNQSLLLANAVSRILKKPLWAHMLQKTKQTGPQRGLSRPERKHNLIHSFSPGSSSLLEEKTVLLVDDVFTTGATMNECARVLKKSGSRKVVGFAISRRLQFQRRFPA